MIYLYIALHQNASSQNAHHAVAFFNCPLGHNTKKCSYNFDYAYNATQSINLHLFIKYKKETIMHQRFSSIRLSMDYVKHVRNCKHSVKVDNW
jgi:hypothetical protein